MEVRAQRLLPAAVVLAPSLLALILAAAPPAAAVVLEPLGEPFVLDVISPCLGPPASVARLADGRYVAVYVDTGIPSETLLFGLFFDHLGQPLGDPFPIGGSTSISGATAQVAALPGGGFIASWSDFVPQVALARRFDPQGVPESEPFEVLGGRLAVGADGSFANARWLDYHLVAQAYDPAGAPRSEPFVLDSSGTLPGGVEVLVGWENPQLAVDPGGNLVTLWQDYVTTGMNTQSVVYARRYSPGGVPLSPASRVNPTTGPAAQGGRPHLLHPDTGPLVATWTQEIPATHPLWARHLDAAGRPDGDPFPLTAETSEQFAPAISEAPGGNFLATWLDSWPTADLTLQLLGADGAPLGPKRVLPLDYDGDWPARFAFTPDARGEGLLFWLRQYDPPILPTGCEFRLGVHGQRLAVDCLPGDRLCLGDDRFRVDVAWHDQHNGGDGSGRSRPLTDDSGAFWFFRDGNLELMTKILDARTVNGHFWFFSGAMTEVGYDITVTDTETGDRRVYRNDPGTFRSFADTEAFDDAPGGEDAAPTPTASVDPKDITFRGGPIRVEFADVPFAPASGAAAAGPSTPAVDPCPAAPQVMCLGEDDRFALSVDWIDPHNGGIGSGQGSPLTDDTGAFWFFNPANLELAVKILDGRIVNGHFWVFYASLTDVQFRLTITDRESGQTRFFDNPPFHLASAGHTDVFGDEP